MQPTTREGQLMADLDRLSPDMWTLSRCGGQTIVTVAGPDGPITATDRERVISERLRIVLWETRDMPVAPEIKSYKRRLPHPRLAELQARIHPQLDRYPTRNTWTHRRQQTA